LQQAQFLRSDVIYSFGKLNFTLEKKQYKMNHSHSHSHYLHLKWLIGALFPTTSVQQSKPSAWFIWSGSLFNSFIGGCDKGVAGYGRARVATQPLRTFLAPIYLCERRGAHTHARCG
jgi:hypothetical protein